MGTHAHCECCEKKLNKLEREREQRFCQKCTNSRGYHLLQYGTPKCEIKHVVNPLA